MDARIPPTHRAALWAWSFAAWSLIGTLLATQSLLSRIALHLPPVAATGFAPLVASMWLWALFTPPIFGVSERLPLAAGTWKRAVPLHVAFAFGFTALDAAITTWVLPRFGLPSHRFVPYFLGAAFACVSSYVATVAIAHAISAHRLASERRVRASELEAQLARSQLRALQMQLRPHFLFNTLHTVVSLVKTGDARLAVEMLVGLGDLLRSVLEEGNSQVIPLRRELDFLTRYLRIEQVRFDDRLETHIDVEPGALDALVPSLILQPLVENAVRHGLEEADRGGRIDVAVRLDAPMLRIEVRNTGASPQGDARQGIGLQNTRARLQHLYGDRHRFELTRLEGGGALASLRIPLDLAAAAQA